MAGAQWARLAVYSVKTKPPPEWRHRRASGAAPGLSAERGRPKEGSAAALENGCWRQDQGCACNCGGQAQGSTDDSEGPSLPEDESKHGTRAGAQGHPQADDDTPCAVDPPSEYASAARPRLAKPAHHWLWVSPIIHAIRQQNGVVAHIHHGRKGTASFMPSRTSGRTRLRPSYSPNCWMRFARISHSASTQISPSVLLK